MKFFAARAVPGALVALIIGATLSGCGGASATLQVGECFKRPPHNSAASSSVTVVSCSSPHYGQVIGSWDSSDQVFPGAEALSDQAVDYCREQFEAVIGESPDTSVLDLFPITPTQDSWDDSSDRTVLCAVRSSDGTDLTDSYGQ